MDVYAGVQLKSIAKSLERLVELKELEIRLKRDNFHQSLMASSSSHAKATQEFWEEFK